MVGLVESLSFFARFGIDSHRLRLIICIQPAIKIDKFKSPVFSSMICDFLIYLSLSWPAVNCWYDTRLDSQVAIIGIIHIHYLLPAFVLKSQVA